MLSVSTQYLRPLALLAALLLLAGLGCSRSESRRLAESVSSGLALGAKMPSLDEGDVPLGRTAMDGVRRLTRGVLEVIHPEDPRHFGLPILGRRWPLVLNRGEGLRFEIERGIASYYWQPQPVATGERFDPEAMTAAHKTLPLGSVVRCTLEETGRSVVVTINDRGPYIEGRIIDLSRAAARKVGLVGPGIGPCRVEVLGYPTVDPRKAVREERASGFHAP